jgi:branched-chain amino acid transport system ATP-binding protein
MLLQIEQIDVSYGGVQALKGISMGLEQGEIMTILGANGAGKTTLVNTICGFESPSKGEILFQGKRITGMPAHSVVKQGIVQVPEGRGIFGTLSVLENLKIGAYLSKRKEAEQKTLEQIFVIFPILKTRRNQSGGSLSGGEQQMLAIGRALMAHPTLLLMDEPTLGLSPIMRKEVQKATKRINESNTSIILVEQNARMALSIAHNGIVLQNGQVVMKGTSSELVNDPVLRESYLT